MVVRIIKITVFFLFVAIQSKAQSLLDGIPSEEMESEKVSATFKSNRLLLGQTTETVKQGDMNFVVMHNFGPFSSGFYEFYGLDAANTALNFDFGLSDKINLTLGRSTYQKHFQTGLKWLAVQQSNKMPVSVAVFFANYVYGMKWPDEVQGFTAQHRFTYFSQLLIARKFGANFSWQIAPFYMHKNLVKRAGDSNNLLGLTSGGRYKLSNRVTLDAECSYLFPNQMESNYQNYVALGMEFDTGGHIFQLRISNTTSLFEPNFVSQSQNKWLDGDISFGFTINRRFTIYKSQK